VANAAENGRVLTHVLMKSESLDLLTTMRQLTNDLPGVVAVSIINEKDLRIFTPAGKRNQP
jgi:nitrate reductase NapAB chaperone NapD